MYTDEFAHFEVEESNINWKNYIPNLSNQWENFFIRESEDASKLYIYDSGENEEYLISDLNLQEGDEFQFFYPGEGFHVSFVDSVYIENSLKHVQLTFSFSHAPMTLTFIESVGPDRWFIYPWLEYSDWVNCFQNQSVFYKLEFPDWSGNCPCGLFTYAAIHSISNEDYKLTVKDDNIELNFFIPESRRIAIYDISGRLYYRKEFPNENNVIIPISSFPKGVYLLKIFNKEKNQTSIHKIIL
jgi:hypothetical protein